MELERHASTPRSLHCKFGVGGLNSDNIVTTNSNVLLEEATLKEEWVVSECNLASLVANSESWQARCRGADMKLRHAHLLILDFRLGIGNAGVGLGIFYDGVQLEAQVPKSFLEPRRRASGNCGRFSEDEALCQTLSDCSEWCKSNGFGKIDLQRKRYLG